jgi:hypothetical protein
MRRRSVVAGMAVVGVAALAAGLVWFQPWKLWVDHRVDEQLPAVALELSPTPSPTTSLPTSTGSTSHAAAPVARLLAKGTFISHEHSTHGTVGVVRQPDGRRILAIANLDTSNGPDVHVWLTDAEVRSGSDGWHVFDDGLHISLGTLKGNLGNQTYPIPAGADLSKLTSVTIWCDRFDVSFGAAELTPV